MFEAAETDGPNVLFMLRKIRGSRKIPNQQVADIIVLETWRMAICRRLEGFGKLEDQGKSQTEERGSYRRC